jgi:hypothetical protein
VTDPLVKAAYEATAREYRYRALLLKEKREPRADWGQKANGKVLILVKITRPD